MEEVALALRIAHLLDRSTAELSGGELQRVALGAALVGRPRLVVLDEPTSQLDPVAGDELIGLLRRLNEDHDTAILLCEHRLERCLAAADRVIALDRGRIVCDAAAGRVPGLGRSRGARRCRPRARGCCTRSGCPPVAGVKRARASLREAGRLPEPAATPGSRSPRPTPARGAPRRARRDAAPRGAGAASRLARAALGPVDPARRLAHASRPESASR